MGQYDLADCLYGRVEPEDAGNARNLIRKLREKLSAHYAEEENLHQVRLEIPKGRYRVVFPPIEVYGGGNDTSDRAERHAAEMTVVGGSRPRGAWYPMAAFFLCLFALVVWWLLQDGKVDAATPPSTANGDQRAPSVPKNSNRVEVHSAAGLLARSIENLVHVGEIEGSGEWRVRYFVLHGGLRPFEWTRTDQRPTISFLSSDLDVVKEIDLLASFNPFAEEFHDAYYWIESVPGTDIDLDGCTDLVVHCRHSRMKPGMLLPQHIHIIRTGSMLKRPGST